MGQRNEFGPEDSSSVDEVLAEYLRRVDAGETVDREAFLRSYPDAAEALRSYFDGADEVERLAKGLVGGGSDPRPSPGEIDPHRDDRRAEPAPTASGSGTAARQSLGSAETIAPRGLSDSWEIPTGPFGSLPAAFGRYRVEKAIGRGAMGSVYLARDTQLDRPVALKVPRLSGHEEADVLDRFLREARAAANLTHPNICRVFDVGSEAGVWFIAMEFVDGRPLAEFIVPGHLHEEKRCANVVRKLAQALDEAHTKGIIHRDLKPANILINQRGEPILMDFGLARLADSSRDGRATRSGMILGSPAYMSPEQANGETDKIGPQSDIYSLGVLLFELLTCQLPFQGSVLTILSQIATKDPPLPSSLRPGLDLRLEAICLKMMAKQPAQRFRSMSEVERELATWLASAPAVAAASSAGGGRPTADPVVFFEAAPDPKGDPSRSPISNKAASAKDSIGGLQPVPDKSTAAKKSAAVTADDVAKQKQRVLKLLAEHNVAAALPLLEKLAQQTAPVFKEAAAWAKSELPAVRERQRKLQEQNATACAKARTLLDKHDYSGAASLLDQIPAAARTAEMTQLLSKASELYDECQGLLTEIEDAIRRKKFDRLQPIVKRYLKLKPDSPKLERLLHDLDHNRPDRAVAKFKDTRNYFDVAGRLVEPKEVALSAIAILALFAAVSYGLRSYLASERSPQGIPITQSGPSANPDRETGDRTNGGQATPGNATAASGPFQRPTLPQIEQRPLTISTHGLPVPSFLDSETVRPAQRLTAWRQEGTFGRIQGAGEMSFPLLPVSEFAIELSMTYENQDQDGLFIDLRSDRLDDEWVRSRVIWDVSKQKVARQLYWFKGGSYRPPLQRESNAGERIELTLLVGNNQQLLFRDGDEEPLRQNVRTQAFHPQLQSYAGTDVTIHRFLIRVLTEDERGRLQLSPVSKPIENNGTGVGTPNSVVSGAPKTEAPSTAPTSAVYLDDLQEIAFEGGWGPLGKHGYSANSGPRRECPRVDGEKVLHSLFPHPKENGYSHVTYRLDGRYETFKATVYSETERFLKFEVRGDDKPLWASKEMNKKGSTEICNVSVAGVQTLQLRIYCRGSAFEGWGWWIGPGLLKGVAGLDQATAGLTRSAQDGWTELTLPGSTLAAWDELESLPDPQNANLFPTHRPTSGQWTAEGGVLRCVKQAPGWLKSKREYQDFVLELEFKLPTTRNGNSGIFIRTPATGHSSTVGMEVQIIDDKRAGPEFTGSIHRAAAASMSATKPVGEWNSMRIECRGDDITVVVNAQQVLRTNMQTYVELRSRPRKGFIGLSNWKGDALGCEFRNIRVKEFSVPTNPEPTTATGTPLETGSSTATTATNRPVGPAAGGQQRNGAESSLPTDPSITNSLGMTMVRIAPGEFWMGAVDKDPDAMSDEMPRRSVRLTKPFYLCDREVTVEQFRKFVQETRYVTDAGKAGRSQVYRHDPANRFVDYWQYKDLVNWQNPDFRQSDRHPVVCVSWNDAQAFCKWLSQKENVVYRLPTEAEWEFACRAGSTARWSPGDNPNVLVRYGNLFDQSGRKALQVRDGEGVVGDDRYAYTAPVGVYQSNEFRLFDMHGNVMEWCQDHYVLYSSLSNIDPLGASNSGPRVARGGSWWHHAKFARCSKRGNFQPTYSRTDLGFRIAR